MLWIIAGLIIGVVAGIYMSIDCWASLWGGVVLTFLIAVLGVIGGFIGCVFSSVIADDCAEKTYYLAEDIDIYALQDNIATEGSFYLGSGHVDEELKYFYVRQTEFGYAVNNVDADDSYIQYTIDRCHLERHSYTFNNWSLD